MRNQWNNVIFSRIEVQTSQQGSTLYDRYVVFDTLRVYPKIQTPNGREMYLPREFIWQYQENEEVIFQLHGQSRGDYKFGLAAGYVGSFSYDLFWNNQSFLFLSFKYTSTNFFEVNFSFYEYKKRAEIIFNSFHF